MPSNRTAQQHLPGRNLQSGGHAHAALQLHQPLMSSHSAAGTCLTEWRGRAHGRLARALQPASPHMGSSSLALHGLQPIMQHMLAVPAVIGNSLGIHLCSGAYGGDGAPCWRPVQWQGRLPGAYHAMQELGPCSGQAPHRGAGTKHKQLEFSIREWAWWAASRSPRFAPAWWVLMRTSC